LLGGCDSGQEVAEEDECNGGCGQGATGQIDLVAVRRYPNRDINGSQRRAIDRTLLFARPPVLSAARVIHKKSNAKPGSNRTHVVGSGTTS
jgi:hypothetical protein